MLAIATMVLSNLPALLKAGQDVYDLVTQTNSVIAAAQAGNRDPTDAEWASLNRMIADLKGKIDAAG